MRRLFNFALDDHRQHRLANHPFADLAKTLFETVEGNNRFGHRPVTAGAADIVVELFQNFPGAFDIPDIAHGNDHPVIDET